MHNRVVRLVLKGCVSLLVNSCAHIFRLPLARLRFFCIDGAGKSKRGKSIRSQLDEIKRVLATRKRPFTSLKNDADLTAIQEWGGNFKGLAAVH